VQQTATPLQCVFILMWDESPSALTHTHTHTHTCTHTNTDRDYTGSVCVLRQGLRGQSGESDPLDAGWSIGQ